MLWTLSKLGSFEERLRIVAGAGYRHVELVDEFRGWTDAEFVRGRAMLASLGLMVDAVAMVTAGFAVPGAGTTFLEELRSHVLVAERLGCPQLILVSGPVVQGAAPGAQHAASIATLQRAADLLASAKMTAVIEPVDRLEQPQIYLDGVTEAFAIVHAVSRPEIKVLYDVYHEQRTHGNLLEKLEGNVADVGLIHVADVPGRHQPGTGEIAYGNIYRALGRLRYAGVVAMEFYPTSDAVGTLRRAREEMEHAMAG